MSDLPDRLTGPAAWIGADMAAEPDIWTINLSNQEIAELTSAANAFLNAGGDIAELDKSGFELPRLSDRLKEMQSELIHGRGFVLVKGLQLENVSRPQAATIFCGIGAHLGLARSQNAQGHILGHVCDIGLDPNDPKTRIYQTHERQSFHTDSCDVVALLCLKQAKQGGDSLLVSAETIFNVMQRTHPDLLALLMEPIATDRRGEVPKGMDPWFEIPVLSWHQKKLTVQYQRQYIDSAARFKAASRLSPEHIKALDMFDALANDERLNIRMRLAPGDMQFVYNHALLHDRTGFTDHLALDQKRHLLRLWLAIPGDRELPLCYQQRYGRITPGDRGGIIVPGARLNAPLYPA